MIFVAEEIKKSIYTHTSTRTLAGGIESFFAQNPAELRPPLPTVYVVRGHGIKLLCHFSVFFTIMNTVFVKCSVFDGKTLWFLHRVQETVFSPNAQWPLSVFTTTGIMQSIRYYIYGGTSSFCLLTVFFFVFCVWSGNNNIKQIPYDSSNRKQFKEI
jgi:hypothetical protein